MRLSVVPSLSTKDAVANKNARMTNVLNEKGKAVIRPGLSDVLDYAGVGAGLIPFRGCLLSIFGDTLYADNAPPSAGGGGGGQGAGGIAGFDVAFDLSSGNWAVGTTYAMGDSVWYNGQLWFSLVSSNTGNTPAAGAYWVTSFPPAWNSAYTYSVGSQVHYGGYYWFSVVAGNLNHTPEEGAYWTSPNPPVAGTEFTLTSAYYDNGGGDYTYGFESGNFGTLDPTSLSGATVIDLVTATASGVHDTVFIVSGVYAQDFFTSITGNSITVNSVDATFQVIGGVYSMWSWGGINMFTAETTYPVTIA